MARIAAITSLVIIGVIIVHNFFCSRGCNPAETAREGEKGIWRRLEPHLPWNAECSERTASGGGGKGAGVERRKERGRGRDDEEEKEE